MARALRVAWRMVRSLRRQFARATLHRVSWVIVTLAVANEWVNALSSGVSADRVSSCLYIVTWCSALSAGATVGQRTFDPALLALTRLRGHGLTAHAAWIPLGRAVLSFRLHAPASLLLGSTLLLARDSLAGVLLALLSLLLLLPASALASVVLAVLATASSFLSERAPWAIFWSVLLVPVLVQSAVFELPSLVDLLSAFANRTLGVTGS